MLHLVYIVLCSMCKTEAQCTWRTQGVGMVCALAASWTGSDGLVLDLSRGIGQWPGRAVYARKSFHGNRGSSGLIRTWVSGVRHGRAVIVEARVDQGFKVGMVACQRDIYPLSPQDLMTRHFPNAPKVQDAHYHIVRCQLQHFLQEQ
jgi:hypothetical protein